MRIVLGLIAFVSTLLVILAASGVIYLHGVWTGSGTLEHDKTVLIARGSGANAIAAKLEEEGVIKNALLFKIAAKMTGDDAGFKAGEYAFPRGISMRAVMDKIVAGDVVLRRITIPEGWTSWQIVQILNTTQDLDGTITTTPEEGSLLPDTYLYDSNTHPATLLADMQRAMESTLSELWSRRADNLPFSTIEEAVTLASIVEKETGIAAERARIAGVFVNRLQRGMMLQTDPTVIYAMTGGQIREDGQGPLGRRLLRRDLRETDSPYNTYRHAGLPPGPIANPGRDAIEAVLNPEDHDYIYFVADGTGGHAFSKTLSEHNANAAKWRRLRKEQGN